VQNESKQFHPDVTSVTGIDPDPKMIDTAYHGLSGPSNSSCITEPTGEYLGDEQHLFDISMVNIPISADDEIFGLSQFFQNFENYPDLL
jgi:hypothetical protein